MKAEAIETAIDKIVAALGPDDLRVAGVEKSRSPDAIRGLVHGVLSDRSMDGRTLSVALWLGRVYPGPSIVVDLVEVLRSRPDVAVLAGSALAHVGADSDLAEVGDILLDRSAAIESRCGAARALAMWRDQRVGAVLTTGLRLTQENDLVRSEIIQALAWAEIRGAAKNTAEEIRPCLRSESPNVRYSAVVALGNLHAVEALEDVAGLRDDSGVTHRGESVKEAAQRAWDKLGSGPRPG